MPQVPAVHDIPLEWNVKFEQKVPNPWAGAVLGSKASGEPPMALGAACAFAVCDAIKALKGGEAAGGMAGEEATLLELPLTVERIWGMCGVAPKQFVVQ